MQVFRHQRAWFWVAVAAIAIALIVLILPHGHLSDAPDWIALLPAFFVGLMVPFRLQALRLVLSLGHAHQEPALPPSFKRPPPFRLA